MSRGRAVRPAPQALPPYRAEWGPVRRVVTVMSVGLAGTVACEVGLLALTLHRDGVVVAAAVTAGGLVLGALLLRVRAHRPLQHGLGLIAPPVTVEERRLDGRRVCLFLPLFVYVWVAALALSVATMTSATALLCFVYGRAVWSLTRAERTTGGQVVRPVRRPPELQRNRDFYVVGARPCAGDHLAVPVPTVVPGRPATPYARPDDHRSHRPTSPSR